MKIALAQINPIVGDLQGNRRKIVHYAHQAYQQGAELVIFPEMCISGYPPQDLLDMPAFIEAVAHTVETVALEVPSALGVIVGAPVPNESPVGKRLFNAALLLEGGRIVAKVAKRLLPTYDVFDEYRYFEPAPPQPVIHWRGLRLGLHICEDMWNNEDWAPYHLYEENPIDELAAQGIDLFVNISASPFSIGKHALRNRLIAGICRKHHVPFVYVNQVGANTELIFDGDSRVHAPDGTLWCCAPSFQETLLIWDTEASYAAYVRNRTDIEDLHDALVLGLRDYFFKTGAFSKVVLGLSGGIDSAVTCALAVTALGSERVVGVAMPSKYSSPESVEDARQLAENLGIAFHVIPIMPAVEAFRTMLHPVFDDLPEDVTEENIQARVRGLTLMALSNKFGYLLLSTGNKSEMAVGYVTLYGDTNGGLAVLADVYKTQVYRLAYYINARAGRELIPQRTLTKPPSAELRPGQKDTDTLPPYEVLDVILQRYIEYREEVDEIVAATGLDRTLVADILRRVDRNEYKRRQVPPGLRVTGKAFGIGRRLPIVMHWNRAVLEEVRRNHAAALQTQPERTP